MKKHLPLFAAMLITFGLVACGNNIQDIAIDYGKSNIYSKSDMDAAIEVIKDEFAAWEGCGRTITVTNESAEFTQCIEFVSDFHSPKAGGGAWEMDYEYTAWQWWLARTDNGEWNLITWGY